MRIHRFKSALVILAVSAVACNLQAAGSTSIVATDQSPVTETIESTTSTPSPTLLVTASSTSLLPTETPTNTLIPSPTSTHPPSLPNWTLYQQGDKGPEVTALQYLLNFKGQNLTVDGDFGPKTRTAVKDFQTSKGLSADGIVGPQTWTKLIQGAQVQNGSHSDAVRAAQYLLSSKFMYGMAVDGIFGPQTEAAVKAFQESTHLTVDGIVGPQTWQTLIGN